MVNGYRPESLQEALQIRKEHHARPYAGGTDLMVENPQDAEFLFLGHLAELKQIFTDEQGLHIGAAVTFTEALESELVPELMKKALAKIAAPAIRNAGTFGGNLGNGSAKADTVLIEYVMDACMHLRSADAERMVPVSAFYQGRKKLDLREDELITEILFPSAEMQHYFYEKVGGRQALAISRISFAGILDTEDGRITRFRAAFGAVADTVLRFPDIEKRLEGLRLQDASRIREDILNSYKSRMNLTRGRVSAEYRKEVCMRLLEEFLQRSGI